MKIEPARILHTQHLLLRYPELDYAAQILLSCSPRNPPTVTPERAQL